MKIEYWSDYACPYCYIGETRLKKALASLDPAYAEEPIEVEMRAFELDPNAPKQVVSGTPERFARKYGLTLEQAKQRVEDISEMGRAEGLDFRYATTRNTNMFDAHRLTKLAHSLGNTRLEELLYRAYFTDNQELADHDVLRRYAAEAGLPAQRVDEVLASDEYADTVRGDEAQAAALGVHAVPFFLVDGKYALGGCYPVELLQGAVMQALEARAAQPEFAQGAACGPEGCSF